MSRVIIIGSGLGGLSCGYILLKNGYDVTILEQGQQIGGCLQCFYRHGAKFETGMHYIGSAAPGQTVNRIMNFLGLSNINLSMLETSGYNTIDIQGSKFKFPNGKENFIEQMSSYFPRESDAIRKYVSIVDRIASASSLNSLSSDTRDLAANTEYQTRSINEVMDSLFKDELTKGVLVGDLPLYAAEMNKTPFSQHAFIMDFYNQSAFRVVGGSDNISRSLESSIKEMGGRIITRQKAVKIDCDDQKAIGVITEDETYYHADYIISTIHPKRLLEMIDSKMIRPAFRARINGLTETMSCFSLYIKFKDLAMPYMNTNYFAYEGMTPWNCEHYTENEWPKGFLYMHMCHEDKAQWAKSGVVISYMKMDDVLKWKGTDIMKRGSDYEEYKRTCAEKLISAVEKRQPGFRNTIEYYSTSTPLSYLDYTGTEDGSMYGVAKDITLGAAGRVPYRTKIPNLFLAGQNVNSHGVLGVIVGTLVTCSEIVPVEAIYKQINSANRI